MRKFAAIVCPILIAVSLIWTGEAQTPGAPATDRVGFPEGYTTWTQLYVLDRPDTRQIRSVWANDIAAGIADGSQANYPYGSVVVMEAWAALKDADGNAILDANGRFQKDPAAAPVINTMRKEKGFGAAYGALRNGEWEYVAYTANKAFSTTPQNSFACANCHLQAGQGKDWVFRAAFKFKGGGTSQSTGAVPYSIIKNYAYVPGSLTVKRGQTITMYNDDVVAHTIADDVAGGWISQQLKAGSGTISLVFDTPGTFQFHCSIHPNMKGKIVVTE
jgi:plastocyanin